MDGQRPLGQSDDSALDAALPVVAGVVVIWLALAGATVGLLAALVAFGAAHVILRPPPPGGSA